MTVVFLIGPVEGTSDPTTCAASSNVCPLGK